MVGVAGVPISVTALFLFFAALGSGSILAAWLLRLTGLDSGLIEAVRMVEVAGVPISGTALFLFFAALGSGSILAAWLLRLTGLDSGLIEAVRMVGASAFSSIQPLARLFRSAIWWITLRRTSATPSAIISSALAAAFDRSMMRPATNGPRSLIRTTTERPLAVFSMRTLVPNGRELCAAVSATSSIFSPLAVTESRLYQEACPI